MPKQRIIAFYLPQYHAITENDEWWGKGFTDWINVVRGKPRFRGHYQPHLPADLGFYDLRHQETRIAQSELARAYGITGFCYHHYWFNGKMLLEKPFNEVLASGKPDFPFCLCWANENWTRRWDGLDNEILMKQNYDEYDPEMHMSWLVKAFSDKRYIQVDGKPLFLIYNTADIQDLSSKISIWRKTAKKSGFENLYLCSVNSVHNRMSDTESINLGFDALVDFIPNMETLKFKKKTYLPKYFLYLLINKLIILLRLENKVNTLPLTSVFSYKAIANHKMNKQFNNYKILPCVIPSWDNSARKKISNVIQNEDPILYQKWLNAALKSVGHYSAEEQIVFINAWNEWAEGCHLEPDLKNGRKFLEATLNALKDYKCK
ncbi:MAG TPA: glycoside hydrolase family 99-like domain-containing protein [Ignavibacteria bacterium]|jgi:lipopolysaccharide biosynthesis protein